MYEKSKEYYDDQFLIDMRYICLKEPFLQTLVCKSWARTYYSAVDVGGKLFFKHNRDDGCSKAKWLKTVLSNKSLWKLFSMFHYVPFIRKRYKYILEDHSLQYEKNRDIQVKEQPMVDINQFS